MKLSLSHPILLQSVLGAFSLCSIIIEVLINWTDYQKKKKKAY